VGNQELIGVGRGAGARQRPPSDASHEKVTGERVGGGQIASRVHVDALRGGAHRTCGTHTIAAAVAAPFNLWPQDVSRIGCRTFAIARAGAAAEARKATVGRASMVAWMVAILRELGNVWDKFGEAQNCGCRWLVRPPETTAARSAQTFVGPATNSAASRALLCGGYERSTCALAEGREHRAGAATDTSFGSHTQQVHSYGAASPCRPRRRKQVGERSSVAPRAVSSLGLGGHPPLVARLTPPPHAIARAPDDMGAAQGPQQASSYRPCRRPIC
jgi:hypothetical protein